MALGEIFIVGGSIITAFILGFLAVMLIGSKTTLNYLKVKLSRGKKILVFVKTSFGWISTVAKKDENTLLWKYEKTTYTTSIEKESSIGRYGAVSCVYVILNQPTIPIDIRENESYPPDFDYKTFNNILIRALTLPNTAANDKLQKIITINLILTILIALGVLLTYLKVGEVLAKLSQTGVI